MDTVEIEDRRTGRVASIRRPAESLTTTAELTGLEGAVRAWSNPLRAEDAERELDRLAGGRPERVVYGLLWLLGLWCSLAAARAGVDAEQECARTLDYRGVRRELSGLDDDRWAILTQLVRRGVVAALHGEGEAAEYLRLVAALIPGLGMLRRHLLTIADGFSQDMERNDLPPWGAAAHVIRSAGWGDGPGDSS
jgi:hypothetical protein